MLHGERLRDLRETRGVSLAELADATHYSKSYLSRVENGLRKGTEALATRCADALGADAALLVAPPPPAPRTVAPGGPAVPDQLPPAPGAFTGRRTELAALETALGTVLEAAMETAPATAPHPGGDRDTTPAGPAVRLLDGMPGAGKTALALHWAHRARPHFPGGVLFADLGGPGGPGAPREPAEVLDGFLRALGTGPGLIPPDPGDRGALLRTLLSRRRTLVVLDNAVDAAQVRPLLPGAPGCLTLVTSRSRMTGLVARDGAVRVTLAPLPPDDALELLRRTLGGPPVDGDPAAADALVRLCGRLPLALRVAVERIAERPGLTLAGAVAELSRPRDRLELLAPPDDADAAVRTVFSRSYRALPPAVARAFRLLSLGPAPGPGLTEENAAALLGTDRARARELLAALAGAHLLATAGPDHHRFHHLLQLYGRELAVRDDSRQARRAALDRLRAAGSG
ncbi:helix-turn-helix transcriptional regulator [Streptomyces sp. NPDC000594]|uniref:helix-turn-helix transcriptional regulator n=1 Tax=Streptomyces sp. NPDC000594 TaxID=3154261 RepID=UPI003333FF3B